MSAPRTATLRVTRRFGTPAPRVFDAWLDPSLAKRWLFATAGRPMAHVAIDARTGGRFRFAAGRDDDDIVHAGRYVEVARPRRLVFMLGVGIEPDAATRVSVDVVPLEASCRVVVTHDGVRRDRAADARGRWEGMLYGLAIMLGAARVTASRRGAAPARAPHAANPGHGGTSCNTY